MPRRDDLLEEVRDAQRSLRDAMRRELERRRERLRGLTLRLRHPRNRMEQARLRCDELEERLHAAFRLALLRRGERLERLHGRLSGWPAGGYLPFRRKEHAGLALRLTQAMERLLATRRARLTALTAPLQALSPQAILERGYAIARDGQGTILRDVAQVVPETEVTVTLARGILETRVQRVRKT